MKKRMGLCLCLVFIPLTVLAGALLLEQNRYDIVMLLVAVLSIVPFFLRFEHKRQNVRELVLVAVMTALSVAGRFLFAPVPGFKPVTAIVIITGLYLGWEAGYLCGSLTALVSNLYFGQGPWTPFQMAIWGLIGLFAALLAKQLCASRILLCIYGVFSGVAYSAFMDVWSTLWYDGYLNIARYLALLITALPFMAVYAVSNVVFLLMLTGPIGRKLTRIKTKYGLLQ
ncbi:MAG TPA: ECF transporter S component [Candidatus Scatovicinus merdipullorum]|nr:ECF transporter S component [Candidatus Scatovicinus merdipullorum]